MSYVKGFLLTIFLVFSSPYESFPNSSNTFNQLILTKSFLEAKHGLRSIECFPFKENIGFTENQIPLIDNCLKGVNFLASVLVELNHPEVNMIGISNRFLRTGGFNNFLIPWDASLNETVAFLKNKTPKEKQNIFLNKISRLKRKIHKKFRIPSLYCAQRISNEQCMDAYERFALIERLPDRKFPLWKEIILDDRYGLGNDSHSYRIKYDASSKKIFGILQIDPQKQWESRKKMYDGIKSKFQRAFDRELQIASYYCSTELTEKNCLDGMTSLNQASEDQIMRMKAWGEVVIDKYNTFIKDDFDVSIRYNLPTDELVNHFSSKENRAEATANAVLAEKLEKRTLNNSSGLRAVCDLEGMRSKLCAAAFKDFIKFVSDHRDYRVKEPWTNVMFVDGTRLDRVNFALNSPVRDTYIYIDAASGLEELQSYLMGFKK